MMQMSHLSPFLCADVEHVVSTDEGISVLVLELSIHILLCLLERYVHVPIQARQHACTHTSKT